MLRATVSILAYCLVSAAKLSVLLEEFLHLNLVNFATFFISTANYLLYMCSNTLSFLLLLATLSLIAHMVFQTCQLLQLSGQQQFLSLLLSLARCVLCLAIPLLPVVKILYVINVVYLPCKKRGSVNQKCGSITWKCVSHTVICHASEKCSKQLNELLNQVLLQL